MSVPSFERKQVRLLCQRLEAPVQFITAIFGPRQTGKTTIVLQALRRVGIDSRYLAVDAGDDPAVEHGVPGNEPRRLGAGLPDRAWLVRTWHAARLEAERSGNAFVLVLDEIQSIPDWSSVVKGLWDADRIRNCPLHVVILGSAPLLMQSSLNESLAGRFLPLPVGHWSYDEMLEAFGMTLDEYCYFGGYPVSGMLRHDHGQWQRYVLQSIVRPAVERDVLAMVRIDKPALLYRLLEMGSWYSGQIVAYNKLVGHLQDAGNTTTLARYLDLLSRVGLLAGLPKYSGAVHRRRASSPKLNVLNTALMTADSGYSFAEARQDRSFWGRIVESSIGAHLLNTADLGVKVSYWRASPHEVDFVLQRGPRLVAIEVKTGIRHKTPRGLAEFARRYPRCETIVVGANGVPLDQFLSEPAARWTEGR